MSVICTLPSNRSLTFCGLLKNFPKKGSRSKIFHWQAVQTCILNMHQTPAVVRGIWQTRRNGFISPHTSRRLVCRTRRSRARHLLKRDAEVCCGMIRLAIPISILQRRRTRFPCWHMREGSSIGIPAGRLDRLLQCSSACRINTHGRHHPR